MEELYAEVAKKIPVQRMGLPVDVARAVAFLISDAAGFINGCVVPIEGGTLACHHGKELKNRCMT